jgi:hypothetical protein
VGLSKAKTHTFDQTLVKFEWVRLPSGPLNKGKMPDKVGTFAFLDA